MHAAWFWMIVAILMTWSVLPSTAKVEVSVGESVPLYSFVEGSQQQPPAIILLDMVTFLAPYHQICDLPKNCFTESPFGCLPLSISGVFIVFLFNFLRFGTHFLSAHHGVLPTREPRT